MKKSIIYTVILIVAACTQPTTESTNKKIHKKLLSVVGDRDSVRIYNLINENGVELKLTDAGAAMISLKIPDKSGQFEDVLMGYSTDKEYLNNSGNFGSIVGRFANRIARGQFTLDGITYDLAINNGPNHLHGGIKGFTKQMWDGKLFSTDSTCGVTFHYLSEDMEEGYPGNLNVNVTYTLTNENAVILEYKATTDKKTVINLTNHAFFNLHGTNGKTILDHKLLINADHITPVDSTLIPTGELLPVEDTPFDFTSMRTIGDSINSKHKQMVFANGGYDHNFVLNKKDDELSLAATLCEPESGRCMEIHTTEPGIQFYSGNFFNGSLTGKQEVVYNKHVALALETQHFPDSPNQPDFPDVIIEPGEKYHQKTIYKFYVEK